MINKSLFHRNAIYTGFSLLNEQLGDFHATFTKAVGGDFKETSTKKKIHGMTANNFHLIDVLHLSDKFRLYAVPIDVWSLPSGISLPPAGRLAADTVMKGSATRKT